MEITLFIAVIIITVIVLIYTHFFYPKYFQRIFELLSIIYMGFIVIEKTKPVIYHTTIKD